MSEVERGGYFKQSPNPENFATYYLVLLRRQVEEEIRYLIQNRHDSEKISNPCMFCTQHREGHYHCNRLQDLRMFLSSITSNQSGKLRPPVERRRIGYDEISERLEPAPKSHLQLPLMYPKI